MEQPSITVETPRDSTILAYGTAPGFSYSRFFPLVLIIVGGLLALFLFWIGLSRPLPIGADTLTIVARPSVAAKVVPKDILEQLPGPWRVALTSGSRWPVLLGGGLGANGWSWFAVTPRWEDVTQGLPTKSAGLASIIYDQAPMPVMGQIRYLDGLKTWLHHPGQQAMGQFELEAVSSSSTTATFLYADGVVHTSLLFEHPTQGFAPRTADVSLDLGSLTGNTRESLLKELPIPHFTLLPTLQAVHLVFHAQGLPEQVQLEHTETISKDQTKQVLAGFGVTTKRVIQLADGTLATELTSGDGAMDKPVRINGNQRLFVQDREIRYGSSTEPLPTVPLACGDRPVVGRLSAMALQKLMEGIGLVFDVSSISGWQLGAAKDGSMILCKENQE